MAILLFFQLKQSIDCIVCCVFLLGGYSEGVFSFLPANGLGGQMKIAKLGAIGIGISVLAVAGLAGVIPMEFTLPLLLFAALMRGSLLLIEKAIDSAAQAEEADRH